MCGKSAEVREVDLNPKLSKQVGSKEGEQGYKSPKWLVIVYCLALVVLVLAVIILMAVITGLVVTGIAVIDFDKMWNVLCWVGLPFGIVGSFWVVFCPVVHYLYPDDSIS